MDIKPIRTKADYRAALAEIETLMSAKARSPEGERLDVLVTLVEAYERSRILRILRLHAHDLNLRPGITVYRHRSHALRFSKTRESQIEEAYSRHFLRIGRAKSDMQSPQDDCSVRNADPD